MIITYEIVILCGEKINTLSILWRNILNIEQEFFYKVDQVENITHKLNNRLGFCKTDQVGLKKPQTTRAMPAKFVSASGVLPSPRPTDLDSAVMQFLMSPHHQPCCCSALLSPGFRGGECWTAVTVSPTTTTGPVCYRQPVQSLASPAPS